MPNEFSTLFDGFSQAWELALTLKQCWVSHEYVRLYEFNLLRSRPQNHAGAMKGRVFLVSPCHPKMQSLYLSFLAVFTRTRAGHQKKKASLPTDPSSPWESLPPPPAEPSE
jgi:hypothetical protein